MAVDGHGHVMTIPDYIAFGIFDRVGAVGRGDAVYAKQVISG
jgi:hypothetical protein